MSLFICLACGRPFGLSSTPSDSHGLCKSEVCRTQYRAWMRGEPGAAVPALVKRRG